MTQHLPSIRLTASAKASAARRATVYLCILVVAGVAWTAGAQQPAAPAGTSSNFTGGPVETLKAEGRLSYYIFTPGARTRCATSSRRPVESMIPDSRND